TVSRHARRCVQVLRLTITTVKGDVMSHPAPNERTIQEGEIPSGACVRHQDKPPRGHEIIAIHFLENAPMIERTWRDLDGMVAGEVTPRSCNKDLGIFENAAFGRPGGH